MKPRKVVVGMSCVAGVTLLLAGTLRGQVVLRSEPTLLSASQVELMVKERGFYSAWLNPWTSPGAFPNDFADNGDGTVTDRATGLIWQMGGSVDILPGSKAQEYVQGLNRNGWAGHADWRLPTIEELASLMEPKILNGNLHIDRVFSQTQKVCWSADTGNQLPHIPVDVRWQANFVVGGYTNDPVVNYYHVKAVRSKR